MWLGGWTASLLVFAGCLLVAILLLAGLFQHERLVPWLSSFRNVGRAAYLIPIAWLVIVLFSLVDLQLGNRLYFNVSSFDHSLRTEFTHAITRTGVPPQNPLFDLGFTAPLRYHYFWFILCSLVERAGGRLLNGAQADSLLNARQAMMGSIVWAGWALAATVPLFFRYFYRFTGQALKRRAVIGVLLLSVTGLDVLPNIFYFLRWHYLYPDMEWWNSPVCAWFSSLIWVPHQIVAVIGCLMGFLLVWQGERTTSVQRWLVCVLAGICFATAVGTSVFVTLVFAVFFFLWMAVCLLKGPRTYVSLLVVSGVIGIVLLAPHLLHIAAKGGGGAFIRFHIRPFDPLDRFMHDHHVARLVQAVLRLALLPVNYALELGFFMLGGTLYWLRVRRTHTQTLQDRAALLLLIVSIGICTFFSSALVNNDLGVRGFMPAQFVLLLWSADWLARWREEPAATPRFAWARPLAQASIAVGVAGTLYAVLLFRFYGFATDSGLSKSEFFAQGETGRRTFAFREAYERLRHILPASAIVQTNPAGKWNDFPFGLYALRQTAAMNESCGAEFGGDPLLCKNAYDAIEGIFSDTSHLSLQQVQAICRQYQISALVMRNTDGAWRDQSSWMWQQAPLIANDYVRVYRFGTQD